MKANIRNIWLDKPFLILDQDEVICSVCNGAGGYYPFTKEVEPGLKFITMCTHCEGQGKIDWVTRIMKKPKKEKRGVLKSKWKVGTNVWQKKMYYKRKEK